MAVKPINYVTASIDNNGVSALEDTAADVSVICEDAYSRIGKPTLENTKIKLTGPEDHSLVTKEYFSTSVAIEEYSYDLTLKVVGENCVKSDVIIGNDILDLCVKREN